MKRNASGPLEVCGRDMSMFYHVFTLPSARADSLKFHGKKKTTDGDGVRQNDFHRIGMALQLQQNPNGTFLD